MKKIELNDTYGYQNFISIEEQSTLLEWVNKNQNIFSVNETANDITNSPYGSRKWCILQNFKQSPIKLIEKLKNRIVQIENIGEWIEEPNFKDIIGINTEGGNIHPHSDPNVDGYTHTRYNIILSYPTSGGHSIYNGNINILEERMVWKCIAGEVEHGSTVVIGSKPRITLSLGFQIKNQIKKSTRLI